MCRRWRWSNSSAEVAAEARSLLHEHALRAGDSIQLASALYLQRQLARPISVRRVRRATCRGSTRGGTARGGRQGSLDRRAGERVTMTLHRAAAGPILAA